MLLNKNSRALEFLYDHYSATLFGVIHRMLQDDVNSEIVLEETIKKIWFNFSQYSAEKSRLTAWMIGIARNLAIEKMLSLNTLHQAKYNSIENIRSLADGKNLTNFNPDTVKLKEIVMNMDEEYRQILYLLFFAGFSQAEVALKLNIPLGTVKTRARMAIMKLRNIIEKLPEGKWM